MVSSQATTVEQYLSELPVDLIGEVIGRVSLEEFLNHLPAEAE